MDNRIDREARLMTATQAAAFLRDLLPDGPFDSATEGEHDATNPATRRVLTLARYGILRHVRVARRVYFTPESLRRFAENGAGFRNGGVGRGAHGSPEAANV
jgi:hypothetical protein